MSFTDLPPGARVVPKPPPSAAQLQSENPIMGALHGFENAMGAPNPAEDAKKSFGENLLDFFQRALTTAPWVLGGSMKGVPGAEPVPTPLRPDVLRQGQAAVENALAPQGPWGPQGEPPNPQPSPVPMTGGPTPETLASGDQAAQQAAYDASLTKAVGTAANRSVAGYNLNTNKNNPAAIASREGQNAVEQALSNLNQPPPVPFKAAPGMEAGANMIPVRVPSSVSAQELRAFLQEQGVPEAQIQESLASHSEFINRPQDAAPPVKPGLEAPPEPSKSGSGATPAWLKNATPAERANYSQTPSVRGVEQPLTAADIAAAAATRPKSYGAARGGAPKPAKPAPAPPAPRPTVGETPKPIEERVIDIPTDPGAKQWLRRAAGILRSAHDIRQILTGNPVKIARTTMQWFIRNYPEVEGRDPQTLNKIAADVLRRLSSGK